MRGLAKRTDQTAILNRLRLFSEERGVAASEIETAMQSDDHLVDFALGNNLSLDWLFCGDIRGLRQMVVRKV